MTDKPQWSLESGFYLVDTESRLRYGPLKTFSGIRKVWFRYGQDKFAIVEVKVAAKMKAKEEAV